MPPHGIMFHHFHNDTHQVGQGSLSAEDLDEMIEYLGPKRIVGAEEWMHGSKMNSLGANDICLTFDDALRCQYDIALPVLEARGLTAFWFVYSSVFEGNIEPLEVYRYFRQQAYASVEAFYLAFEKELARSDYAELFVEKTADFEPRSYLSDFPFYTDEDRRFRFIRDDVLGPIRYNEIMGSMLANAGYQPRALAPILWMDDACVKRLDDEGHVVGMHSYSHPTRLTDLPKEEQSKEYHRNFRHLKKVLGHPVKSMSHPCNSYSEAILVMLEDLGIEIGFRANMAEIADRGVFEYPREDHANVLKEMRS